MSENTESRVEHRIPTTQYGYISVYLPLGESLQLDMAVFLADQHTILTEAFKAKEGIPDKEMNQVIDNQLLENGQNSVDTWEKMSPTQKEVCQIIKRSLKRLEARESKLEIKE